VPLVAALKVGDPMDEDTDVSLPSSHRRPDRVKGSGRRGRRGGAEIVAGARCASIWAPTVLANVTPT